MARLARGPHQHRAGVVDAGSSGVAHVGHAPAGGQMSQHVRRRGLFTMAVGAQQRLGQTVGLQQALRHAGVLRGDEVAALQHGQGAQADVGEVADGRGHHQQASGRQLLARA
jgi:hypothetical protein